MHALAFPKHSPDLDPLEYAFWDAVNRGLRRQEASFAENRKETRVQFLDCLRKTIVRTPSKVLAPVVRSMKRRCLALKVVKGRGFGE